MSIAPAIRHAPLDLWRIAEAFLRVLHNLFGAPEDIAAQHTLTRAAHTLLASWLGAGEAMLRRLLLIEAAAYALGAQAPAPRTSPKRARTLMSFEPDKPQDWRVSFAVFYSAPASRRPASTSQTKAPCGRFASAWPLAERFEAMLRVFNEPARYAKRLARRLRAHPSCITRILRAPPAYAARVDRAEALTEAAERAHRRDSG